MYLYEILKNNAVKNGNHIAVSSDDYDITYAELLNKVNKIALIFKKSVLPKSHVAILINNSIDFIISFFALNSLNAVIIPLYSKIEKERLIVLLNHYNVSQLAYNKKTAKICDESLFNCVPCLKNIIAVNSDELVNTADINYEINKDIITPIALILLSSGTTGTAKGIMLSHENILSNLTSISDYLKPVESDILLLIKNINHASSIIGEMLLSFYNNCTLVITSKLQTPQTILSIIEKKQVTMFFAVPALLNNILKFKRLALYNIKKLRTIHFYGSPIAVSVMENLIGYFKDINIVYSYGLSEASPRVSYIDKKDILKRKGSSGIAIKNVRISIRDNEGNILPPLTNGEICVEGTNVMLGYYKDPVLTKKVIRENVLFTGDTGFIDNDGFLYVIGRKDNLMIVAGNNVYPEQIENVIKSIDGVEDVFVTSEQDEIIGEKIIAFLVLSKIVQKYEILNHCKRHLEDYKIPEKILITEAIAKTENGKLKRGKSVLQDIYDIIK